MDRMYDATCIYGGIEVGDCTIADAEFFETAMKEQGTAKAVSQNYCYFSKEFEAILNKCMTMESEDPSVIGTADIEIRF